MVAQTVAFINQKGGVGKTTTTVNIGAILAAEHGKRVLLVDLDPQGSLSDHVGLDPNVVEESIYNVLIDGMDPAQAIRTVHGLDALPANLDLSAADIELAALSDCYMILRNALAPLRERYDYILLDCPPSLGLLTVSGLTAADTVVVAMEPEYLALRGISQLLHTVGRVTESLNPCLAVGGVVFCRFDGRITLAREVRAEVEKHLPGKVFATTVRRNIRLAEAPSRGLPIIAYDPCCAGTKDYRSATLEFVIRFDDKSSLG